MLAMTPVIVDFAFNNTFLTFYILRAPPKRRRPWGNLPPTLYLYWNGCVNNALVTANDSSSFKWFS